MVKLKYDSREVDRSKDGDLTPPKPGVYRMKIESATYEKDKDRVVFVTRQQEPDGDGNGKGYGFWTYVPLDIDWKMDQFLQAVGYDTENNPTGEFDVPKDFVGKTIMGRVKSEFYTPDGSDTPEYRPKLARPLPYVEDGETEDEIDESEFEGDVAEEETEEPDEGEEDPTPEEVLEMGSLADEGDDDAIIALHTLAEQAGIDDDEIDTWGEVAEMIAESMKPKKPSKPSAKKAAPPTKKAAAKAAAKPKPEPEEDSEDYESWELGDLKEEAKSRGLSAGGSKTAIIARLRTADDDPFAD